MRSRLRTVRGAVKAMELPMSLARRPFPGKARISALAGMFALPLLASCAYDDGYYDPSPGYGYDYGNGGYNYGYGGVYGHGGYGYNYGYGSPCWPYGCGGDWHHRHHHHQGSGDDGDNHDDGNNHHHHHGSGDMSGGRPPTGPGRQANDAPDAGKRPDPRRSPSSPYIWVPQPKDSKN
jgi:hypothetical protein